MEQYVKWPPPAEWEEVVKTAPGGRYHLHGWRATEGFAFRFEDPVDALYFKLRWF